MGARLMPRVAAHWATSAPPPRRWLVDGLIPLGAVTLLSGEGGIGKSALMVALGLAVTTGSEWLGRRVATGPVLGLFAEDDSDEIGRRLRSMASAADTDLGLAIDFEYLAADDLAETHLAISIEGKVSATDLFREIERIVATTRPVLVVLDCAAELFGGDENRRSEVAAFLRLLNGLAAASGAAIVLISHPSLTGIGSGSGLSGSTAWNNSVRSRLYLEMPDRDDPDRRRVALVKSNYARVGQTIEMRILDGRFVAVASPTAADRLANAEAAEAVFLSLLRRFTAAGRYVADTTGTNYAPAIFAREPEAKGLSKDDLREAMSALFLAERIVVERVRADGKDRKRLVETAPKDGDATGPATGAAPPATASDEGAATGPRHRPATAPAPPATGPATTPLYIPPAGGGTGTTGGAGRPDDATVTVTATDVEDFDDDERFPPGWDHMPDQPDWPDVVAA